MSSLQNALINDLPLNKGVGVLMHNKDGLLALEKPAGLMSHPNKPNDNKKSILTADYDSEEQCYKWTNRAGVLNCIWLINRLDSPTSGIILLGLNSTISDTIKAEFSSRNVSKVYYAIVRHKPSRPTGIWEDRLIKDIRNGKQIIKKAKVVTAKTRFKALQSPIGGFPVTVMKLMPLTGRTHQLRIQCQKHGVPIVGDRTYGNFPFNREVIAHTEIKRMLLHAAETHVHYSYKGQVRDFSVVSKLPEEFKKVIDYRPGKNTSCSLPNRSSVLSTRRFKL